jgi:hypothetical protein
MVPDHDQVRLIGGRGWIGGLWFAAVMLPSCYHHAAFTLGASDG